MRDYGAGIPPEEAQRALQPFTRLDSARSGSGHCGLGLAIVERIARSHAGTLAFESPPDGGLCVVIGFDVTQSAAACHSPVIPAKAGIQGYGARRTILGTGAFTHTRRCDGV